LLFIIEFLNKSIKLVFKATVEHLNKCSKLLYICIRLSILKVIIIFFLNIFDISVKCPWWGLTWGVGLGIAGMILKYGVILGWDGHFFYQEGFAKARGMRFNHFRPLFQNKPHEEGFLPPDY
jgi:hypothetical protein